MLIRMHRGTLADSLTTKKEIEPTYEAVRAYLKDNMFDYDDKQSVHVEYYGEDKRPEADGWQKTYIVTVNRQAVGFTNSEVK